MRYDSCQFREFDGLDNRKTLMRLMVKLGDGLDEQRAGERRARFLKSLIPASTNGFADRSLQVTPCSAVQGYHLLVAITGCLGVPIDQAARQLEKVVSHG